MLAPWGVALGEENLNLGWLESFFGHCLRGSLCALVSSVVNLPPRHGGHKDSRRW
jgi:hypothetical protein